MGGFCWPRAKLRSRRVILGGVRAFIPRAIDRDGQRFLFPLFALPCQKAKQPQRPKHLLCLLRMLCLLVRGGRQVTRPGILKVGTLISPWCVVADANGLRPDLVLP
jgi:hypothetical protein